MFPFLSLPFCHLTAATKGQYYYDRRAVFFFTVLVSVKAKYNRIEFFILFQSDFYSLLLTIKNQSIPIYARITTLGTLCFSTK